MLAYALYYVLDIKECINGTNEKCEQRCIELEGGFRCDCNDAYRLRNDNESCEGKYVLCIGNSDRDWRGQPLSSQKY